MNMEVKALEYRTGQYGVLIFLKFLSSKLCTVQKKMVVGG